MPLIQWIFQNLPARRFPLPISALLPNDVLRVDLKPTRVLTPSGPFGGFMGLQTSRAYDASRSPFRGRFFCGVISNDAAARVMMVIVPDQRSGGQLQQNLPFMLELSYDDILAAQLYITPGQSPETVIGGLMQQSLDRRVGQLGVAFPVVPRQSTPVLII